METFLRAGLGNAMLALILALGAASAGCLLRHRPAVRHALWLLVLLKLITPPLWVVPLVRDEPALTRVPEAVASVVVEKRFVARPDRAVADAVVDDRQVDAGWWASLPPVTLGPANQARLAIVWLTGSLLSLTVTGVRIRRWNQLLKFAQLAPDDVQDGVDLLANSMGIAHPPRTYWFPGASAPMLWAFGGRARLIVPCKLWDRLDDRQRTTLLVHELAHLKRRDHWIRVVELLATTLYWWLPLAWIARWALREAEEQCCDAWVVSTCPGSHRTYAETLLDTVDFLSETGRAVPLAASGFGHAHHLKRRVTMIMQGKTPRGLSWTGLLTIFGLAALLLPLSPTWAQKTDDDGQSEKNRDVRDDSEDSDLGVIQRKLAEQIRRLQTLERRTQEKARAWAEQERKRSREARSESSDEAKQADADRDSADRDEKEKAKDKPKERRVEVKVERISPRVRLFKYHDELFKYHDEKDLAERSEDGRSRLESRDVDKELVRAKLEVERARAQLLQAERQLERLGAELKARRSGTTRRSPEPRVDDGIRHQPKEKREARPHDSKLEEKQEQDKSKAKSDLDLKPEAKLDDFKLKVFWTELLGETDAAKADRFHAQIEAARLRKAADLLENQVGSSTRDDSKKILQKIAGLGVLREKYAESLHQMKNQVRDFDHDPAVKFTSERLKQVVDELQRLDSLYKEKTSKRGREESR